jgi:histone deacetylase complex regulatory component SIN3
MNESISMIRSTVLTKSLHHEVSASTSEIPQFFYPNGKPLDSMAEQANRSAINAAIGMKNEITPELAKNLTVSVLGLPNYFSPLLMQRCTGKAEAAKMTREEFNKVWKELENETPHWRAFWLLSSEPKKKHATI